MSLPRSAIPRLPQEVVTALSELGATSPTARMFHDGADAVDLLFSCLPIWESDPYPKLVAEIMWLGEVSSLVSVSNKILNVITVFLHVISTRPSTDPDSDFLRECAEEALQIHEPAAERCYITYNAYEFALDLAHLSIKTPASPIAAHLGKKAQQMAYYRWLAYGRKDELHPRALMRQTGPTQPVCKAFLPDDSDVKCKGCGMGGGNLFSCSGCLVSKDGHVAFRTAYCSRECQTNDWQNHRASCRELRRINRAATLYHELLLHLYKLAHYRGIGSISEEDGFIYVKYRNDEEVHYTEKSNLRQFPEHLAPSPEVANAVVMAGKTTTDNHFGVMEKLFNAIFKGTFRREKRVSVLPKNVAFVVERDLYNVTRSLLSSLEMHEVVRITTVSGLDIAFDPCGCLHGWKELISPWAKYEKHRIAMAYPEHEQFKALEAATVRLQGLWWIPDVESSQVELVSTMVDALQTQARSISGGGEMLTVLNLNNSDEFQRARAHLLDSGKTAADTKACAVRGDPTYQTYITRNGWVKRIGSQEMYDKLKQVWLTDELYEEVKNDPAKLKELWAERLGNVGL